MVSLYSWHHSSRRPHARSVSRMPRRSESVIRSAAFCPLEKVANEGAWACPLLCIPAQHFRTDPASASTLQNLQSGQRHVYWTKVSPMASEINAAGLAQQPTRKYHRRPLIKRRRTHRGGVPKNLRRRPHQWAPYALCGCRSSPMSRLIAQRGAPANERIPRRRFRWVDVGLPDGRKESELQHCGSSIRRRHRPIPSSNCGRSYWKGDW